MKTIRSYLGFLPALVIIASLGLSKFIDWGLLFAKKEHRIRLEIAALVVYAGYLLFINLSLYPNENLYFNSNKLYYWQSSYDNPYRQAVNWLNKNAPQNAKLAYLDGSMEAISPIWLRPDIRFSSSFSGFDQKGEYIASIVYPEPPQVFPYLYLDRFLDPVYQVKVGNRVVLKIWQNFPSQVKPGMSSFKVLSNNFDREQGSDTKGDYWQINLDQSYKLASVTLAGDQGDCTRGDGLFYLNDFIVPTKVDSADNSRNYLFPGEQTKKIRFYPLDPGSCFSQGRIVKIVVVDDGSGD